MGRQKCNFALNLFQNGSFQPQNYLHFGRQFFSDKKKIFRQFSDIPKYGGMPPARTPLRIKFLYRTKPVFLCSTISVNQKRRVMEIDMSILHCQFCSRI